MEIKPHRPLDPVVLLLLPRGASRETAQQTAGRNQCSPPHVALDMKLMKLVYTRGQQTSGA